MAKPRKMWVYSPRKLPKPKIPDAVKAEVTAKANELIETVLKPEHVKEPPEDYMFNYIVDIYITWFRSYLYFCSKYACPGPNALSPFFEARFTRMEYVGGNRFNLGYMRHTGQWIEVFQDLTVDECMDAVREDAFFQP